MCMDMNEVNAFIEGVIDLREQKLNDNLFLDYNLAIEISQAVWYSDDFPKEAPKIDLKAVKKEKTKEEILDEIFKFQLNVHNDIKKNTR